MQIIHYVLLVCAALAAGLPSFGDALPPSAAPYVKAATAALTLLVGVLGAISPAVSSGKFPAPPRVPPLPLLLMTFLVTMLCGCSAFAHEARTLITDAAQCLQANADLPDDKALAICGIEAASAEAAKQVLAAERQKRTALAMKAKAEAHAELGCGGAK